MPELRFHKYQGTGNDFIVIDDRRGLFDQSRTDLIASWCERRFGIGADGVILIRNHDEVDFEMVYFNPDGTQSLCGNGSRCAVKFTKTLGLVDQQCSFLAIDGVHKARIEGSLVSIRMQDVGPPARAGEDYFINTGSPHHIRLVSELSKVDVFQQGSRIRYSDQYRPDGTNVNFVQPNGKEVMVRTYERGVENETLSCGTGVTAVALVMAHRGFDSPVSIQAEGGNLTVSFTKRQDGSFSGIYLSGPAEKVYEGVVNY